MRNMSQKFSGLKYLVGALTLTTGILLGHAAEARPHDHGRHNGWYHGHGGYNRHYDDRGWRRGRWVHGRYNGRFGWWWVIGSERYYYAAPVYPYPVNPYVQPEVVYAPPVIAPPPEPSPGLNLVFPIHIR